MEMESEGMRWFVGLTIIIVVIAAAVFQEETVNFLFYFFE